MEPANFVLPLLGGVLIGLSAAALLLFHGRIAGISGIAGGLLRPGALKADWRLFFLAGLVLGGVLLASVYPAGFAYALERSIWVIAVAGLLVGFGTRLGNGCTSGHGVCGISRLSKRSIVATMTFMVAGAVTTFVVMHLLGGSV
jgi:uncharacterized protein